MLLYLLLLLFFFTLLCIYLSLHSTNLINIQINVEVSVYLHSVFLLLIHSRSTSFPINLRVTDNLQTQKPVLQITTHTLNASCLKLDLTSHDFQLYMHCRDLPGLYPSGAMFLHHLCFSFYSRQRHRLWTETV